MLAGLLKLLPWVKQWHNALNPDLGMGLGDYYEGFLDSECRTLGLTRDDLRAWRPAEKGGGRNAKAKAKAALIEDEGESEAEEGAAPTKPAARKRGPASARKPATKPL